MKYELLKAWFGETRQDRISLALAYFGGLICPAFAYLYWIGLKALGVYT